MTTNNLPRNAKSKRVVCVVSPNKSAYSETFIRAHIERLPAQVVALYGDYFPTHTGDDQPLLTQSAALRLARGGWRRLLGLPSDHFQRQAIKKFLKQKRVDAVLAEYGPTGVAMMRLCAEMRIPLIVHFHGFDAFDQRTVEKYIRHYPRLFDLSAAIVAASASMRNRLIELGVPSAKIVVNPYGVDTIQFNGADPASASPTFISIGRFVDKKAPHLTLLSFKLAHDRFPEARLVMVGDGELLEACKQIAKSLGIASAVDFLGVRNPAEIAVLLRGARALVQHSLRTSYGDSESLGIVFLEAGASGLPVIATRHDGIPEVVVDGETGFLVEEGDINCMAERMMQLAQDPGLADRLGKAARARMCAEFNIDKSMRHLWGIIESAMR